MSTKRAEQLLAVERWRRRAAMPLFYFDVFDNSRADPLDHDGMVLPDLSDACQEALNTLSEMARDLSYKGSQELAIVVREADGSRSLRVALSLTIDKVQ
jgi:hypothetical protein